MEYSVERCIAADHPCLPGHFPGHPLVPGVVILQCVVEALAECLPAQHVIAVDNAKFVAPLLPDQTFTISLQGEPAEGRMRFECALREGRIALGQLRLSAAEQGQ